jgi:hypothetical protein
MEVAELIGRIAILEMYALLSIGNLELDEMHPSLESPANVTKTGL